MADTHTMARDRAVSLNPIISPVGTLDTVANVAQLVDRLGALLSTADSLDDVRGSSVLFSAAASALKFEVEVAHV